MLEPALPLLPDEPGPLALELPLLELEPELLLELDELLELGELGPLDHSMRARSASSRATKGRRHRGRRRRAGGGTAHQRQQHTDQCACREPAHELGLMRLHEKSGVHGVYTTIAYEPVGFRSKDHTIISVATGLPPSNRGRKRVLRIFLSKRSTLGSLLIAGCATASSSSVSVSGSWLQSLGQVPLRDVQVV